MVPATILILRQQARTIQTVRHHAQTFDKTDNPQRGQPIRTGHIQPIKTLEVSRQFYFVPVEDTFDADDFPNDLT